jgi:hypothetical protein
MQQENAASTTSQGQPQPPIEEHILEHKLAEKCISFINQFCSSSLDKGSAMVKIAKTVGESATCSGMAKANSIGGYNRILDSNDPSSEGTIESEGMTNPRQGRTTSREQLHSSGSNEIRDEHETHEIKESVRLTSGNAIRELHSHGPKRKRKDNDLSGEESDDNAGCKFNTSTLSWEIEESLDPVILSPVLCETHKCLQHFSEDYQAVKSSILTSSCRPEFPDSEWDNVI